jgi:hypothetical protein
MKFNKWTVALAAAGLVSLGHNTQAEEAGNAVMTSLSKTTLSGYVDTSVSWSDTNAITPLWGRVAYQNTAKMDGFNLDVIGLTLEQPLDESDWAAGYHIDVLVGPDASFYSGISPIATAGAANDTIGIKQAYVATRAPIGNGLDLKLGVYDAIIGYEVFTNGANPNYSRSMAYNLEPFSHTGALASYQFNEMIGLSAGIANTSRSVLNDRPGTLGASSSHFSYMAALAIVAPESAGVLSGATLYAGFLDGLAGNTSSQPDTVNYYVGAALPTPVDGLALGLAYDRVEDAPTGVAGIDADVIAAYASYQATDKLAVHGRIEYLSGDAGLLGYGAADDEELLGLTATLDYSLWDNVITRLEGRWDQQLDDNPDAYGSGDDVFTLTLNAIYNF